MSEITFDTPIEMDHFARTTPREMAAILRGTGLGEGEMLDLLKKVADDTGGWTPQLNLVGLLILKPDAPEGEEKGA